VVSFVDKIYLNSKAVLGFLQNSGPSMLVHTSDSLRKSLLLSSASFFEEEILNLLKNFSRIKSSDQRLSSFIENEFLERRYDQLFNWKANNINNFIGLFGKAFLAKFEKDFKKSPNLNSAVINFIEIGRTRNEMIHGNLGSFFYDKTLDEVYNSHKEAELFLEYLKKELS
jgi:hypothetical protein